LVEKILLKFSLISKKKRLFRISRTDHRSVLYQENRDLASRLRLDHPGQVPERRCQLFTAPVHAPRSGALPESVPGRDGFSLECRGGRKVRTRTGGQVPNAGEEI